MLKNLIKEIKIGRRILRQFALVMAVMLGLVVPFVIIWFNDWVLVRPAWVISAIGAAFLCAGFVAPMRLKPVYIGWMLIALVLGMVVTRIIITIVFYLMITPIGWVRRTVATRDPMGLKPDPVKESYWIDREAAPPGQIKKQY